MKRLTYNFQLAIKIPIDDTYTSAFIVFFPPFYLRHIQYR